MYKKGKGWLCVSSLQGVICADWSYVNLAHKWILWQEGILIDKVPPYDPAVMHFLS